MAAPPKTRPRTASRFAAVQALFQSEQAQTSPETVIDEFVRHRLGELPGTGSFEDGRIPDALVPLFARIVREATQQQDRVDALLAETLSADWPLARIEAVLRAILRAGAYEIAFRKDVPARVVISEYVDVTHGFYGEDEPGLVNAVLDAVAREVRPKEMVERPRGGARSRPGQA